MNDILESMQGCKLPSFSGKVIYTVVEVALGQYVKLHSRTRKNDSKLPWKDIYRVYEAARSGTDITPKAVDAILENSNNRHSSTMCALILAMQDKNRIR